MTTWSKEPIETPIARPYIPILLLRASAAMINAIFQRIPDISGAAKCSLALRNAFMTAVVRCAPPQNKPLASELTNCGPYLDRELVLLSHVRVVLVFGQVAFKAYLGRLPRQEDAIPRFKFKHGQKYAMPPDLPVLIASYHPSKQNTQTGRLTSRMMNAVLRKVKSNLNRST